MAVRECDCAIVRGQSSPNSRAVGPSSIRPPTAGWSSRLWRREPPGKSPTSRRVGIAGASFL